MTTTAAWVCIFSPLIGALVTPLLARVNHTVRDLGAVFFSLISAVAAMSLLPELFHPHTLPVEQSFVWLERPFHVDFGVLVDPLSIVVTNVVAVVSSIIMIYCLGYMHGDSAQTRFWMWMNGFIGSMLLLVLSNNLLFLFIGWKLVGICSYGLIGFYYQDQRQYWIGGPAPNAFVTPSQAAVKALVVTGVGDMLMLSGFFLVYFYAGTLNYLELYNSAPIWLASMGNTPGMVVLVTVLLLAGPIGKSAQFPFHEWLPEAMAGPGPVSALIHAATMVKSGVYLVARLVPLFYYAYWVAGVDAAAWFFHLTAWVGVFTAFLAATQGLVAVELKKVLAYSTVSQIGYMMLGLGVAGFSPLLLLDGYTSGIFHLVSHALFKACLFLCAGTVIHAAHSIYISDMGGLRRHLPMTWIFMMVGAVSLIGLPPFPGFWSKDAVLLATADASLPLFLFALVTVSLTAFYTVRFFGFVFYGPESNGFKDGKHLSQDQADGSFSMRLASGILAIAIVLAGLFAPLLEKSLHHSFEYNLEVILPSNHVLPEFTGAESTLTKSVPFLSVLFLIVGAVPAGYLYLANRAATAPFVPKNPWIRSLFSFFRNRWFIDTFYNRVFVSGSGYVARFVAEKIETRFDNLIHKRFPWLLTNTVERFVNRLRADTEELFYNVSYVLMLFVMLLVYLFVGMGGG